MTLTILEIIREFEARLREWLNKKPTGNFQIKITANEGGIRDIPKITMEEDIK